MIYTLNLGSTPTLRTYLKRLIMAVEERHVKTKKVLGRVQAGGHRNGQSAWCNKSADW